MIFKTVTLQEANGLLPLVRERFFRIHILLAESQRLQEREHGEQDKLVIDRTEGSIILTPAKKKMPKKFQYQLRDLEHLIQDEIQALLGYGVFIKGLFPPHIDFLSVRQHEAVYLCWQGGEKEISHWHSVDDGFPGRYGISEPGHFGPYLVH